MPDAFFVRYDGLDATNHRLDMRRFGEAMVGIDRVVSFGLVAFANNRLPKKRERFPLQLRAQPPVEGSFNVPAILEPTLALGLPLVHELFNTALRDIVWRWLSLVLNMTGGREKDAEPHFMRLSDILQEMHKAQAVSEERNRQFLLEVLRISIPATKGIVAPVGASAETLEIKSSADATESTLVDTPMADVIRSSEKLEVGDMEPFTVRVDGLIHHRQQLKIEHPDIPGTYISADVRDPAFLESDNVYLRAMNVRGLLNVLAKPTRKQDGSLHRLYIMDASEAAG